MTTALPLPSALSATAAGFVALGGIGFDAAGVAIFDGLGQFAGEEGEVQEADEENRGHQNAHPRRSGTAQEEDAGDAGEERGDGYDHFSVKFGEFFHRLFPTNEKKCRGLLIILTFPALAEVPGRCFLNIFN
ncbi:MAG: hypothetical protein LBV79_03150 [Candidatus Adiutrix sp.]|nr:hypothetical protein [Candidatus Adiutrix sp.]